MFTIFFVHYQIVNINICKQFTILSWYAMPCKYRFLSNFWLQKPSLGRNWGPFQSRSRSPRDIQCRELSTVDEPPSVEQFLFCLFVCLFVLFVITYNNICSSLFACSVYFNTFEESCILFLHFCNATWYKNKQ